MSVRPDVILIRHAEVHESFRSICYGELDVPLSEEGHAASLHMAEHLAACVNPLVIFHSGLTRTKVLATAVAQHLSRCIAIVEDRRLRERNYGDWQGKTWDEIYQDDPDFHDLIHKPDSYRPPRGETTTEMQERIVEWFSSIRREFASAQPATILAISHSGPIAALCGKQRQLSAHNWQPWMLAPLQGVQLRPSASLQTGELVKLVGTNPMLARTAL